VPGPDQHRALVEADPVVLWEKSMHVQPLLPRSRSQGFDLLWPPVLLRQSRFQISSMTGEPLDLGEIGAEIWIIERFSRKAEMIPSVTVPWSPSGLPMTSTVCPSTASVEWPSFRHAPDRKDNLCRSDIPTNPQIPLPWYWDVVSASKFFF
jgi:hypothetical protein